MTPKDIRIAKRVKGVSTAMDIGMVDDDEEHQEEP